MKKIGQGKKVLVAMSGGVDSSVVAALLKEQGYQVVGCFMRLGSDNSPEVQACDPTKIKIGHQGCCSVNDASDARLVAALLDIPFYVLDFKEDFGRIIDYFVDEYNAGRTPNPCVRCNDWLKFGKLHDYAHAIDAHFIASGHYARIDRTQAQPKLLRGIDKNKDQSYVLFGSPKDRLAEMLLPIGDLEKSEVRAIAQRYALPVFDKPDSQEICFVPDNDYASLVQRKTPQGFKTGQILDTQGNIIGEHPGQQHFTIGQRRGTGVALGYPIYVTHKDPQGNTITVGQKEDLLAQGLIADQTNWFITPPKKMIHCQVKIRYNAQPVPAQVRTINHDQLEILFQQPQSAVTPGQAVVCYLQDHLIGGGWIKSAIASNTTTTP